MSLIWREIAKVKEHLHPPFIPWSQATNPELPTDYDPIFDHIQTCGNDDKS